MCVPYERGEHVCVCGSWRRKERSAVQSPLRLELAAGLSSVPGAGLRQCLQVTDRPCGCAGGGVTQRRRGRRLPGRGLPSRDKSTWHGAWTLDIGQVGTPNVGRSAQVDEWASGGDHTPHVPVWAVRRARGFRPAGAHLQSLVHLFLTAAVPLGGRGVGWVQHSLPVGAPGLLSLCSALRSRNQLLSDEQTGERSSYSSPVLI